MKQKSFITLLIVIVVIGGVIGGVFAGGIVIGKNQGQEAVDEDMQSQFEQFASRTGRGNYKKRCPIPVLSFPEVSLVKEELSVQWKRLRVAC